MNIKLNYKTKNTIKELEAALNDLQTAKQQLETFQTWQFSTNLTFYDLKDVKEEYPKDISQIFKELFKTLGHVVKRRRSS
jgi:hypothetical protein